MYAGSIEKIRSSFGRRRGESGGSDEGGWPSLWAVL